MRQLISTILAQVKKTGGVLGPRNTLELVDFGRKNPPLQHPPPHSTSSTPSANMADAKEEKNAIKTYPAQGDPTGAKFKDYQAMYNYSITRPQVNSSLCAAVCLWDACVPPRPRVGGRTRTPHSSTRGWGGAPTHRVAQGRQAAARTTTPPPHRTTTTTTAFCHSCTPSADIAPLTVQPGCLPGHPLFVCPFAAAATATCLAAPLCADLPGRQFGAHERAHGAARQGPEIPFSSARRAAGVLGQGGHRAPHVDQTLRHGAPRCPSPALPCPALPATRTPRRTRGAHTQSAP